MWHGRHEAALAEARRVDAPGVVYGHVAMAVAASALGLREEAASAIAALRAVDPGSVARAGQDLAQRNPRPRLMRIVTEALARAAAGGVAPARARAV